MKKKRTKLKLASNKEGSSQLNRNTEFHTARGTVKKKIGREKEVSSLKIPLTEELVEKALRLEAGFVSRAARRLGCSVGNVCKWIKTHPILERVKNEIQEETLDLAEYGLRLAIKKREKWAIEYYLNNKGKQRGYTQGREITLPQHPIVFHYEVHNHKENLALPVPTTEVVQNQIPAGPTYEAVFEEIKDVAEQKSVLQ